VSGPAPRPENRCYWHISRAAQERIDEAAKTLQVIQGADELRTLWRAGSSFEVRPIGASQRLTSAGQNEDGSAPGDGNAKSLPIPGVDAWLAAGAILCSRATAAASLDPASRRPPRV
jgi:hypothetical protein